MTYAQYINSEWSHSRYKPGHLTHQEWLNYLNGVWGQTDKEPTYRKIKIPLGALRNLRLM